MTNSSSSFSPYAITWRVSLIFSLLLPDPLFKTHFLLIIEFRCYLKFIFEKRQSAEFSSMGQEHCEFPALLIQKPLKNSPLCLHIVFLYASVKCTNRKYLSREHEKTKGQRKILWLYFYYFKTIHTARQEMMMEKYFFKDIKVDEVHARLIILPSHQMIFYVFHVETAKMSFF